MISLEFMECEGCRAKLGSPILCEACCHNRKVISVLKALEVLARNPIKNRKWNTWNLRYESTLAIDRGHQSEIN